MLLPALNPACTSALGLKPVEDDFQHDFARVIDKTDGPVVMA